MIKKYNIYLYKDNKLEKSYKNIKGINKEKKISLILDEIKTIIKENELIRENNEFKFNIDLIAKTSNYLLKQTNIIYDIEVIDSNIIRKEKEIIIKYRIETNEEEIQIRIIESTW